MASWMGIYQDGEVDPQFFEDVGIKKLGEDPKSAGRSLNRKPLGSTKQFSRYGCFRK